MKINIAKVKCKSSRYQQRTHNHGDMELERVNLHYTESALRLIARKTITKNNGARGLRALLENILMDAMYEIPDVRIGKDIIEAVVVYEEAVGSGAKILHGQVTKSRTKAIVWDYFEKIKGDDGLQKTRCTNCNKVYSCAPNSGTSIMRRHLRKCCPQPLNQLSTETLQLSNTAGDNDELANVARASKKLKIVIEDLQLKTEKELMEFIWMNKRNIGLLEETLHDKGIAIKQAVKSYEDEINRKAKVQSHKENSPGGTSIVAVKIEVDDHVVEGETTGTNVDIVAINGDENQGTYNASIALDDMLNWDTKGGGNIAENVVVYNEAKKEGVVQELETDNCSNILRFRKLRR
ncbi:hypothetical protein L1887_22721 [Cichorium endivia]|nr:hypothetical protein L1887_22721 [Cichorium endivia]